jgi:hypothetical protein
MQRTELIQIICSKVTNEKTISKKEMENSEFCGRESIYKKGLYFLYNFQNEVIYVGKIGEGSCTSLYDRMVGQGEGAHNKENWYKYVSYGKFHPFDVSEDELKIIERLAIFGMGQPIYNDEDTAQTDIDKLCKDLTSSKPDFFN